ncbi:MAG TPA: hypothetical protein VKU00_22510, partial [Chthonomonadaceae bacterium]|nr:hypothetical protein [Chthonomonadaceae bacterium]
MTEAPTTAAKSGRRWALLVAIGFLLLTVIPYLVGLSFAFDRRFMWLGYNLDDSCVYLSWMRQAADGSFHALNLFTTEPQHGMALNPLFLVLGRFASLTGLPLLAVYHLARIVFGVGLLLVVWEFLVANVASSRARKLAFLFVCFSAGIGWLPAWWESRSILTPIDRWQPEAITFLSLYLSPLFCFSMALQVGILLLLQRGERTGQARYAVAAGLCGLILGLTHTYDVATMAAIWSAYVVVSAVVAIRRKEGIGPVLPTVLQALLAGIIAAPGALYIYAQLKTETVFHKRMEVQTLSVPLYWVLAGYGLTFLFALLGIYGAKETLKPAPTSTETDADLTVQEADSTHELLFNAASLRLLTVWLLVNLAVAYINVPFQRKLLQGAHFPVAILAGVGCVWLIYRIRKTVSPARFRMKAVAITLLLGLTNFYFMARDIGNYRDNRAQTGIHRTYLLPGEINALNWIREHTPP